MRYLVLTLLSLFVLQTSAQDTTWVQTFTYDTISTRRAIFPFPASLETKRFEKVLMYYNIKCDPLTPWDGYNCGEWDYLAYAQIWDHTGQFDSVKVEHPQFLVNNVYFDPVSYVSNPYYHIYQNYQKFITYASETDNDFSIGSASTTTAYPFGSSNVNQRTQILWTAAELSGAGITAGNIDKLRFDIGTLGGAMGNLSIRFKHTSASDIFTFDESGWSEVYHINTTFLATGTNTLNLTYPFNYDGTSDILMDISFEQITPPAVDNVVSASTTANTSVVYSDEKLGYLNVEAGQYAQVELSNYDFGDDITISFWCNGDAGYLPVNTSILEAQDSLGNRTLNIHHPWSSERTYWDAGDGTGYDRIDKAVTAAEYEGNWHHWAFTKNAATGQMKIYLDGVEWHSGSGLTRPVGIVNKFILGANKNGGNNWAGLIDEFRVWDVEVSAADIATWKDQKITAAHPNYADLVVYYDFDNENSVKDKSGNNRDAMTTTPGMIEFYNGSQAGQIATNERPDITFVQGTYTSSLDSTLVVDSVLVDPIDIMEFQTEGQKFTIVDVQQQFPEGYAYLYDYLGNKIDSTFYSADVTFANDSVFYYEDPYEILDRYEIGRFITPYGIGFSLGPNGFTYIYDVTDYQTLLMGDVDFGAHNTQELIDVKFAFVEGIPPRDVVKLEKLWNGRASYTYSNLDNDVNLSATTVDLDPTAAMYKIRTRMTGHGHNGTVNCCEWGQGRYHEILLDGVSRFNWDIWQETECGDNPNIGQGGTWPYAREGWCPGDKVEDNSFEITPYVSPGGSVSIDYDITDVPAGDPAQGNGNYVVTMHLLSYSEPNHVNDAAIVDVLNPNDWEYYSKWNPTCQNPRVILKNTGSATLTSCKIYVWIGGFDNVASIDWTGSLEFLEEEMVEIPVTAEWWYEYANTFKFTAMVQEPNGVDDEYEQNNKFSSSFEAPKLINEPFYVWLKSNNKPEENQIWIYNQDGDTVYSRYTLAGSTEYKDTLDLPDGCYTLEIYDTDHDGLGYWYSNTPVSSGGEGETTGFLRLRKVAGGSIENFTTDWGHYLSYTFSVGYGVGIDEEELNYNLDLYPNPTEGEFTLALDNFTGDRIQITVLNELGQLVYEDLLSDNNPEGLQQHELDFSHLPNGIYLVNVTSDDQTASKKLILK